MYFMLIAAGIDKLRAGVPPGSQRSMIYETYQTVLKSIMNPHYKTAEPSILTPLIIVA